MDTFDNRAWFAVQVKTTHEKRVTGLLDQKQCEWFLPLWPCRRRWSDRIITAELPLFPGYVFCRIDIAARLAILTTPSVLRIVGNGKEPLPVDDKEIFAIQATLKAGLTVSPFRYVRTGQRVQIDRGPLCGLEGIVTSMKSRSRLILSVSLLQRSVAVEIDEAWVTPVSASRTVRRSPLSTTLCQAN